MLWPFGNRQSRGSVVPQGTSGPKPVGRGRRQSIRESFISSLQPPSIRAPSKRNSKADVLASDPASSPTSLPETPAYVPRDLNIEVTENTCNCGGQADLETEVRNLQKAIAEKDAKLQYYQSEQYKTEVLSIHQHFKATEEHEPRLIAQRFSEITGKVEDISGELSELLLSLKPVCQPTARSLFKGLNSPRGEPQPSAKNVSRHSVRPEEYIDFGCRALINRFLMDTMFNYQEVHPSLSPEENHVLYSRYQKVRALDPQVIAGHWRTSTIKSLGEFHKDYAALAQWFCGEVLIPFCSTIYNLESLSQTLDPITIELSDVLKLASEWRSFTDRTVVMYDFHPQFLDPGAEFDIGEVEIEGTKPAMPPSNRIISTTRLGLFSSRALGDSRDLETAIQSKVGVLTSEYFAVEA
ncbi:unnamed protein product [Rhizoctonia solani]|uniref:Uncharacterized protein n=1 Tax=Rhizoctonia solani TaxID=456999 RepID=A0A8H3DJM4_9AGAM|nr:unnamed protein product [Rhizoctonia solani]CAE7059812.1 unnamed protein product [Rhizoctonia solani]